MAQLSRPYQIALGAVALLALVWVIALRGHSANPSEPAPSSPPSKPAPSASSSSPGASSRIYHGPAPGLEGLTRDIAKAHGAVATSERSASQLGQHSARASGQPASSAGDNPSRGASSHGSSSAHHAAAPHAAATHAPATHVHSGGTSSKAPTSTGRAPRQIEVEHELAHGKTVLLLFWDPRSSVDNVVRSQVLNLGKGSKGKLAVHTALADQVGQFGTVTEVAHVYQTPTILIVGRHGLVTTLTGLVDEFSLRQAVREAEQANR